MKLTIIATALAMFGAAPAFAQSADAASQSWSQSSIQNQGDNVRGISIGGASSNSTAPCVLGYGALGVIVPIRDKDCKIEGEALILVKIANMRNGPAKKAAVYHFCANTPSMRKTLVALGYCVMAK